MTERTPEFEKKKDVIFVQWTAPFNGSRYRKIPK